MRKLLIVVGSIALTAAKRAEPENVHKVWNLWLLIAFLGATWIATEFLLKSRWVLLYTLRKYVSLVFAATACVFLVAAFPLVLRITHPQSILAFFFIGLLPILALAASAALLVTASWTTLRGKQSARVWGIAASLIFVLVPIWPITSSSQPPWREFGFSLVVGVVGLVAFSHRLAQSDDPARTLETTRNPGDGTSALFNAIARLLLVIALVGAYLWWLNWTSVNRIFTIQDPLYRTSMWVLVLFFILIVHELGHTLAGLVLGMKLRGFVAGPLHWYIREGKWEFEFKLAQLLGGGGTDVVPATADFPRWHELIVLAGGPLANLLTGAFALWIAIGWRAPALEHVRGALGLFAAWSIVFAVDNLLPSRTPAYYSDGAQIYQILSNGPWGDLQRVSAISRSTLLTPLRPRDHDIQMILRAAEGITRGATAMWLRLLAYTYYLDQGRLLEAGEAFKQAGSIYEQCASQVTAELLTEFVFASAYVLRDATATRLWWTQMEAKKPTRFNVDYWKAASALHWIEGDLGEANEAWAKSNALAQALPHTGAYDFDRDCCFKLRQVIDQVAIAKTAQPI
jgi:Peptidase family M50